MLSLLRGGECHGIAMRMERHNRAEALINLLESEPPFPPAWVAAQTPKGAVVAIAFVAPEDAGFDFKEPPEAELVDMLASAVGHVGSMADYLLNTVAHLEAANIRDAHLWHLQERVAERLALLVNDSDAATRPLRGI